MKVKKKRPKKRVPIEKKGLRALDKILWEQFSLYKRRVEADDCGTVCCISCGTPKHWTEGDCGHYISRSYSVIKYHDINNHFQCKHCNGMREGNKDDYRKEIIKRYGLEAVEELEQMKHKSYKGNRIEVLENILKYQELNKELDKRLPRKD
jgi:hypothetical protein